MPDRFGGATDYSTQFAYLADTYLNNLEDQADKAQARNESEQAAKDTEAFARYDAGKMSGDELLGYIRRRISQTAYDPKQQAEWKKALLQYTESINDSRALAAFEKSNDYNGYIEYLRGKLGAVRGNPTKRAELQGQINGLIDQRDQQSVTRGAERIMLQIAKKKATYSDLLEFYKVQLRNTREGSSIREQIRQQITSVTQQVRTTNISNRKGNLDRLLAANTITPQVYATRLKELARQSGFQQTSPDTYNSWMQTAEQAARTIVDMGRLEEIDGKLLRGDITPQQAETLYYLEAERYKIADPKTYQQIRNEGYKVGHTPVPGQTQLPNPGVLGLPGDRPTGGILGGTMTAVEASKNRIFKWITQLDGSEYGQVNCVYAASAMLAYAMGYREQSGYLSGGDLRYLSGDRTIGTNLDEAEAALGKLGISGLRNWNDKHIDFEAFKKRVGQRGMPAVLMGINNNLPDNLKAFQGAAKGHGVFVAAYDPKKKAFLWYDPAVSKNQNPNYKGIWVSEDVVRNFGWGPSYSDSTGSWNFSGQALFAPPGTIKGNFSADNVRRPDIHYVNVDDAPVRPETPKRYRGYNHRGPSTVEPVGNEAVDKKGHPRAARSGSWATDAADDGIVSAEELQNELAARSKMYDVINKQVDAAVKQGADPAVIRALDQQTLDLYDRDLQFIEAARDQKTGVLLDGFQAIWDDRMDGRTSFLAGVSARNSVAADVIINTAIRDARKDFELAMKDPDPDKALKSAQVIKARLQIINGVQQAGNLTETPIDDLSTDGKYDKQQVARGSAGLDSIIALLDMVTTPNPEVPISERMPDILNGLNALGESSDQTDDNGNVKEFGTDLGNLVMGIVEQRNYQDQIDAGTHIPVVNGQTGGTVVVPLVPKYNPQTGAEDMVPDFGMDNGGNPVQGIQVPVQTSTGWEQRWVLPGVEDTGFKSVQVLKGFTINGVTYEAGSYLSERQLMELGPANIRQGVSAKQLQETPLYLTRVQMPDRRGKSGNILKGQTFYQDDSGAWFTGAIPVSSFGVVGGQYIGMNPDTTPQFQYRPWATSAMYPTPFQGDRASLQQAVDDGTIQVPKVGTRGFDGMLTDEDIPEALPRFASNFDPKSPRNQLGMPTLAGAAAPAESEDDRTERILEAVKSVLDNARLAKDQADWLVQQGIAPEPIAPVNPTTSGPTGVQGPQMPQGDRAFNPSGPVQPGSPLGPMGPQGAMSNMPSLNDLAGSLGVKVGGPMGPQMPQGNKPVAGGPKGPQGPGYTPPAPKVVRGPGGKKESNLPKIGTAVMVGGTQINLPGNTKAPTPQKHFTPPPPKMGSGGAASASIGMLTGNKGETKKGPGGFKS